VVQCLGATLHGAQGVHRDQAVVGRDQQDQVAAGGRGVEVVAEERRERGERRRDLAFRARAW
jgi:hypothetical protein